MSNLCRKPATKRRGFLSALIRKPRGLFSGFLIVYLASTAFAYSFVVFGDSTGGDGVFQDLITKLNNGPAIAWAVNTGDFVASGRPEQYAAYRETIARLKYPVYHVLGNHDGVNGGWRTFLKTFGPLNYSFTHEGDRFIVVNNAFRESFDSAQFKWLKDELARPGARHKFVFMHKPVFDPSEIYQNYVMSSRAVTDELQRLFEKYRVERVFAGHIHGYARSEKDGVVYTVSGGAGSPLHLPPEFGGFYNYVRVEVNGGKINDRMVRIYE